MSVIQINICDYGSTGNIMCGISNIAAKNNISTFTFSLRPRNKESRKSTNTNCYFTNFYEYAIHYILVYITGFNGCFSHIGTIRLLRKLKKIKPKIIHLHNLHTCYINLPMLFNYIKKHNIPVVWTLHDCWSFTGQCPHFTIVKCDKWKTGCYDCPQYRQYPESYVDRTKTMYKLKKKWFTGVQDMTIVTPSQWLADLVKQSYLKDYPVQVINNGIDLSIFKPTKSDFREKHAIQNKIIVLGVAFGWGKRKGLDVFVELSKRLDERYQIVLVGTDEKTDKQLPKNIISIHRTQDQRELAEIYTAADIFANPTREENFPTVNIESLACGTPIITFNTGGSPEIIDETCGIVVPCDDIDAMLAAIEKMTERPFLKEDCIERAKIFDKDGKFMEYIKLYENHGINNDDIGCLYR